MSKKAEILMKLYRAGKVTVSGLQKAVSDGVITEDEFREILAAAEGVEAVYDGI